MKDFTSPACFLIGAFLANVYAGGRNATSHTTVTDATWNVSTTSPTDDKSSYSSASTINATESIPTPTTVPPNSNATEQQLPSNDTIESIPTSSVGLISAGTSANNTVIVQPSSTNGSLVTPGESKWKTSTNSSTVGLPKSWLGGVESKLGSIWKGVRTGVVSNKLDDEVRTPATLNATVEKLVDTK